MTLFKYIIIPYNNYSTISYFYDFYKLNKIEISQIWIHLNLNKPNSQNSMLQDSIIYINKYGRIEFDYSKPKMKFSYYNEKDTIIEYLTKDLIQIGDTQ